MNVLMGGVPIGRLEQMDAGVLAIEYADRWLAADRVQIPLFDVPASRRQEALRREGGQLSLETASGQRPDPAEMGTDLRRVAEQRVRFAIEGRRGLRRRDPDRHRRVDGRQRGFGRGVQWTTRPRSRTASSACARRWDGAIDPHHFRQAIRFALLPQGQQSKISSLNYLRQNEKG